MASIPSFKPKKAFKPPIEADVVLKNDRDLQGLSLDIKNKIRESTECLTKQNQLLYDQLEKQVQEIASLKSFLAQANETIETMSQEVFALKQKQDEDIADENRRKENRVKHALRKRKPVRDRISYKEFVKILSLTAGKTYPECQKFVAFVLLYITGLRIQNLSWRQRRMPQHLR